MSNFSQIHLAFGFDFKWKIKGFHEMRVSIIETSQDFSASPINLMLLWIKRPSEKIYEFFLNISRSVLQLEVFEVRSMAVLTPKI